ncbi:MAG: metallophosphoesterase family protein [Acidimicrobiales bacterium]
MPIRVPFSRLTPTEVFAHDATTAQVVVRTDRPDVDVEVLGRRHRFLSGGGAAVFTIDGLAPASTTTAAIETRDGATFLDIVTRHSIGSSLTRIATVSDVHLGLDNFGLVRRLRDDHHVPYALRCLRAAFAEAETWGAELIIVKGDLTESGLRAEWDMAADVVNSTSVPVIITPGNHDHSRKADVDPTDAIRSLGLEHAPVQVRDLVGIRVIVADTSIDGKGHGSFRSSADEVIEQVRSSPTPVLVATHHNVQRTPLPWFWPPGVSSFDARPVVTELDRLDPPVFLTSGHTHRNRVHHLGGAGSLVATEVSSTSDYPGVWAGYEVSGTAIRQTVHRIAEASAVAWTERTIRAVGGVWPRWSQGRLDDRCVDLRFA